MVMISKSKDGSFVTGICLRTGWRVVRGSSSRGGKEALEEAVHLFQHERPYRFLFTVDGPRGPRRACKFGVVALASRLGIPVLPIAVHPSACWNAKGWDRMAVPKPFSRVVFEMNEWIHVPQDASPTQLETARRSVEKVLSRDLVRSSSSVATDDRPSEKAA